VTPYQTVAGPGNPLSGGRYFVNTRMTESELDKYLSDVAIEVDGLARHRAIKRVCKKHAAIVCKRAKKCSRFLHVKYAKAKKAGFLAHDKKPEGDYRWFSS